jgi:hypothetical protein
MQDVGNYHAALVRREVHGNRVLAELVSRDDDQRAEQEQG